MAGRAVGGGRGDHSLPRSGGDDSCCPGREYAMINSKSQHMEQRRAAWEDTPLPDMARWDGSFEGGGGEPVRVGGE